MLFWIWLLGEFSFISAIGVAPFVENKRVACWLNNFDNLVWLSQVGRHAIFVFKFTHFSKDSMCSYPESSSGLAPQTCPRHGCANDPVKHRYLSLTNTHAELNFIMFFHENTITSGVSASYWKFYEDKYEIVRSAVVSLLSELYSN